MVTGAPGSAEPEPSSASVRIIAFSVSGGIFRKDLRVVFPEPPISGSEPLVLILSGKTVLGKQPFFE